MTDETAFDVAKWNDLCDEAGAHTAELNELPFYMVRPYGRMAVLERGTTTGLGRRYLCACGWSGLSNGGTARRHARACSLADSPPLRLFGS